MLLVFCLSTERMWKWRWYTWLLIVSHPIPIYIQFRILSRCNSFQTLLFSSLLRLARIKPRWASPPLSSDFVKAIDFELCPAPSLKPQKAYSGDSICSLMRSLLMIHRGSSSTTAPTNHLGATVIIWKKNELQTFNYIFLPLFHFVTCFLYHITPKY